MKVLIIGLGSIATKHVSALRNIDPFIEIYALRSSEISTHREGITDLYSFEDAQNHHFDFIIISNPTSAHKATIDRFKNVGVPLFIEKPLYHQLSIEETVNSVEQRGILTYVACNLRFLDSLRFVKHYLSEKDARINEVNVYCGSYLPGWRENADYKKVYSALPELGGGVHIDLIHEIDYIYWLFGFPVSTRASFSNVSSLHIDSWDYANYCLKYPSFNVSVILNYYRRDAKRTLEIVCENKTVYVDLLRNEVVVEDEIVYQSEKRIIDSYKEQLSYFLNCIKNKTQTFNTIRDAYNVLQICLKNDIEG